MRLIVIALIIIRLGIPNKRNINISKLEYQTLKQRLFASHSSLDNSLRATP